VRWAQARGFVHNMNGGGSGVRARAGCQVYRGHTQPLGTCVLHLFAVWAPGSIAGTRCACDALACVSCYGVGAGVGTCPGACASHSEPLLVRLKER